MEIFLRIPKGWSKPTNNTNEEKCDFCGAKLWIGPGNQIYCDSEHDLKAVKSESSRVPAVLSEEIVQTAFSLTKANAFRLPFKVFIFFQQKYRAPDFEF